MKERPIIFGAPMVRAILDGTKTQTRRVVKPQPDYVEAPEQLLVWGEEARHAHVQCPYGSPGDRLWVRETWRPEELDDKLYPGLDGIRYRADNTFIGIENTPEAADAWGEVYHPRGAAWRPSIHMPRWSSRLTLEVADVRVERLQRITKEDARAEGCAGGHDSIPNYPYSATPTEHFRHVWDSINGKKPGRAWADSPWVWVVEFRRVEP